MGVSTSSCSRCSRELTRDHKADYKKLKICFKCAKRCTRRTGSSEVCGSQFQERAAQIYQTEEERQKIGAALEAMQQGLSELREMGRISSQTKEKIADRMKSVKNEELRRVEEKLADMAMVWEAEQQSFWASKRS